MSDQKVDYHTAIQDFRRARRKASLERILAHIGGQPADLFSYEEVRRKLRLPRASSYSLKSIPVNAIIGSVKGYQDFTRNFLPKHGDKEDQWVSVELSALSEGELPPIEVFQIGDVYFVLDGDYCVSVARQRGIEQLEAHVMEIQTPISLAPDLQPDDLIIKAEYAEFLHTTHLDELRPGIDLTVTAPGRYRILEEHIALHQFVLQREHQQDMTFPEAAARWYDDMYHPIEHIIEQRGILRDFPNRTATDLYLWICEYQAALEEQIGWTIPPEAAATDLVRRFSAQPHRILSRITETLSDALTPDELEWGRPTGEWRKEKVAARRQDRLFNGILVAVTGQDVGWCALDQAIEIARREEGQIYGLHITRPKAPKNRDTVTQIQTEFDQRCQSAGVQGKLIVETGDIDRTICGRARWGDLVVSHLPHPQGFRPIVKLRSSFRTMIRRCPRPVLAVPKRATPMNRLLLAYDGSPKAIEALYVSAYLSGRWKSSLIIASIQDDEAELDAMSNMLAFARGYLNSRHITATFVQKPGVAGHMILTIAAENHCDLVLMGGYGYSPVVEAVIGSTLDHVLRHSQQPVLICR